MIGDDRPGLRAVRPSELAVALAAVAVTHLAFEVALVAALPRQFSVPHLRVYAEGFQTWQPDVRFKYWNLPGVVPTFAPVAINDDGLRGEVVTKPKPAGECRVIVVGDSNTAAMQLPYDEIFTTRLGMLLDARARERSGAGGAARVRIVNAGIKASGLAEHLLWLRHRGFALEPDLIIVQVAADDADDDLAHGGFALEGERLIETERLLRPPWWRAPLLALRDAVCNRSLVYYRLWTQLRSARTTVPSRADDDVPWWMRGRWPAAAPSAAASPAAASLPSSLLDIPAAAAPSTTVPVDYSVGLSAALLAGIAAEAASHGVGLLVLPLPHPLFLHQGHPRLEAIMTHAAMAPASVVRVDETLRAAHRAGRDPYLALDGHLNADGHGLVAEALVPAVEAALAIR